MKAMGPFPEERYRSLKELREHLERFVDGRPDETPGKAAQRRPLKGLTPSPADLAFTPVEELAPTRVVRRPEAPAPAPIKVGPVRAVSVMHGPPVSRAVNNSTDEVPSLKSGPSPRTFAILERAAWVACGALIALIAAYVALRPSSKAPSSTVPPAVLQPVATPLAPARNVDPPLLGGDAVEPTVFDADLGGRNAAKAARDCFTPERAAHTISFGAGLLFAKDEALARRVYLSPDEPLSPDERRCINHGLVGASAGGAPAHNTIVEYRFRLRPDGTSDVKAAIQK